MNTVLSAMALDYPPEKLSVYLSDDGGSSPTLKGIREACAFARSWIPFCRRFGIQNRSPKIFFSSLEDDLVHSRSVEYEEEKEKIKKKYEQYEESVERAEESEENDIDHPPAIEVIHDKSDKEMPLLVYVSCEKRPYQPHHFKAGALNVLIVTCTATIQHQLGKQCVSTLILKSPSRLLSSNSPRNPITSIRWPAMDGLQGPMLSGTGFYMKRGALYGDLPMKGEYKYSQLSIKNINIPFQFASHSSP